MSRAPEHYLLALGHVAGKIGRLGKGPAGRKFKGELERLQSAGQALSNVYANRSPIDTEAAHIAKVAGIARKFDREVTAAYNRLGDIHRQSTEDIHRRIDAKVNLRPDAFAPEIRETLRRMNRKDRSDLIHTLVTESRGSELAAIIKAPALASGLTEVERSRWEEMMVTIHAPGEREELIELQDLFEQSLKATEFAGSYAGQMTNAGKVAAIEQGDAAAKESVATFEQSLASAA